MSALENLPDDEHCEFIDDALDLEVHEPKKHIQWKPFGDAGFFKSYCEEKAHILIRFRIRNGQEFLACVQRDWKPLVREAEDGPLAGREGERDVTWSERVLNRYFLWREVVRRTYRTGGQEKTMLVDVVEPMKGREGDIPSVVWFDAVENFESRLVESWYESAQRGFVCLGRVPYGEFGVLCDDGHYPTSEEIESAAQAMKNISRNERDVRGNLWDFTDVVRQLSGVRLRFSEQMDGVSIVKDPQSGVELLDVLFGPIQFV